MRDIIKEQNKYSLDKLFSDSNYCKEELCRIREAWGDKTTFNLNTIDAMYRTFGFMLLYCDDVIVQNTVDSMMMELSMRETYYLFYGKGN
jgi:hypothetical protein